jgi:hypothetical protein
MSTILYRVGAFFFNFGVVVAVLSIILVTTLYAIGSTSQIMSQDVMAFLQRFSTLFAFSSMIGALTGYLTGKTIEALIPGIAQAVNIWFIANHFIPVYTPLAASLAMLLSMLPLPTPVIAGLSSIMNSFIAFTIVYYLAARIGVVPP